jgi:hypothetical protein
MFPSVLYRLLRYSRIVSNAYHNTRKEILSGPSTLFRLESYNTIHTAELIISMYLMGVVVGYAVE